MGNFATDLDFTGFDVFSQERRPLFKKGVPLWKMKKGDNAIIILPPIIEPEFKSNLVVWKAFGILVHYHPNMTPNGDSYPCVNVMKGERCPFCEQFAKLDEWDEKKVYKPRKRGAIWILDKDEMEKGAQLWTFGWAEEIFPALKDAITDPETGKVTNILKSPHVIYFKTKERNDKYHSLVMVAPRMGTKEIPLSKIEKYFSGVKPFSEVINWPSKDELAQFFDNAPIEDDIPNDLGDDIPEMPDEDLPVDNLLTEESDEAL